MICQTCAVEYTTNARLCGECGVTLTPAGMIGLLDSLRLGFSRYADFVNRSSRAEFWWWFLFINISATIVAPMIDLWLGTTELFARRGLVAGIFTIAVFIPTLSVGTRRMHDVNRSGWWLLLYLIPVLGWAVLIYFATTPSNSGPNKFGLYSLSRIHMK